MLFNDRNKSKAIVILILFTVLFTTIISGEVTRDYEGTDFHRHMIKAQGNCDNIDSNVWNVESCKVYRPLLGFLGSPFSGSGEQFAIFGFLLIGVLIPIALFWITKHWVTVLFYFTTTNFFYAHIDGIYAQALATLFVILMLGTKKWQFELGFLVLATLSHGHGLELGVLVLLAKYLPKAFLACSGTFGKGTPGVFEQKLPAIGGVNPTVGSLIHPFVRIIPLPFLLLGTYQNIKDKKTELVLITIIGIVAGFTLSSRAMFIASVPMIIGLTSYYVANQKKWGKHLIVGALLMGVYQLYAYLNLKACVAL
ncbi:MAG TPA: hypothetical protein ENH90_01965 [bacterium]|nr:hypothetical protein [bacterium]